MPSDSKPTDIQYIATIRNVREVILLSSAASALWNSLPTPAGLNPILVSGRLSVMISATSARWMGLKFRELTISIACSQREAAETPHGYFLAQAFNSSALLAAMERRFFKTPYQKANIEIEADSNVTISLLEDEISLMASRKNLDRTGSVNSQEIWQGPIYLPQKGDQMRQSSQLFYACLGGFTQSFAFDHERDVMHIGQSRNQAIFQLLNESEFNAAEWRLRNDAIHARSRTYQR